MFTAPGTCPSAYSQGSRTSTTKASCKSFSASWGPTSWYGVAV